MTKGLWSSYGTSHIFDCGHGFVELDRHRPGHHCASLRVEVDEDDSQTGLGTFMVGEAIEYAKTHDIHRIELTPWRDNPVSTAFASRIAAKYGFRYEGMKRQAGYRGNGQFVDAVLYAWVNDGA